MDFGELQLFKLFEKGKNQLKLFKLFDKRTKSNLNLPNFLKGQNIKLKLFKLFEKAKNLTQTYQTF